MTLNVNELSAVDTDQFSKIWLPWLTEIMKLTPQPEDLQAMADPVAFYGASGGAAFIAKLDGQPVGAVAVKGLGAAGFEFCKLVVTNAARGQGAGRALILACIDYARERNGPDLWLQSFRQLDVALGMYERMGFQHAPPPPQMAVLARTQVIMKRAVI